MKGLAYKYANSLITRFKWVKEDKLKNLVQLMLSYKSEMEF